MPDPETIAGYSLGDVRRGLRDAIDRGDTRHAARWTAELVATPAAVGSLWASYWVAWAAAAGGASPTIPILLRQSWERIRVAAQTHLAMATTPADGWAEFRNDPQVRAIAAETTTRLLQHPRQTPVVWPSKEITTYDVSTMRAAPVPPAADGPIVMSVWQRGDDALELRLMAGRFLTALEIGDLRIALSAIAWSLMPTTIAELKVAPRGPPDLTPRQRGSALWFWLELGRAAVAARGPALHRGWSTALRAVAEAFAAHYRRWTAADRMRVLLAYVLQVRAALAPTATHATSLWVAPPLSLSTAEIDLPYKELAAELAGDPDAALRPAPAVAVALTAKEEKRQAAARIEAQMAAADARIMAMMGLAEE
jgi:hypothetical protein